MEHPTPQLSPIGAARGKRAEFHGRTVPLMYTIQSLRSTALLSRVTTAYTRLLKGPSEVDRTAGHWMLSTVLNTTGAVADQVPSYRRSARSRLFPVGVRKYAKIHATSF